MASLKPSVLVKSGVAASLWLCCLVLMAGNCAAAIGDVVAIFRSPGGWPEGLASNGQYLWNADGYGGRIYVLDPSDGSIVRDYPCPGSFPEGLAFANGYLYNCRTGIRV